jgi:hypothetical protein
VRGERGGTSGAMLPPSQSLAKFVRKGTVLYIIFIIIFSEQELSETILVLMFPEATSNRSYTPVLQQKFFRFKAKLIEHIFALFRFQKFIVSLLFCFVLFLLHFIFVSLRMQKQAKKHFFRIEAKKISLPFRFGAKMMAFFHFISLQSKNDGSFLLLFRFISL